MELQIHLKDTDIKNVTEENHTLNSQNKGLRVKIKKLEFKIHSHEYRITCLKAENKDAEDAKEAAKELRQQLDKLKREMRAASDQKRNLRERLRMCQRDLSAAKFEKEKLNEDVNLKSKLNKQLEDDLQHLEHKKRSLQKKVYELQKAISSPSGRNHKDSVLQRLLLESPIPEAVRRPKLTDCAEEDSFTSTMFGNLLSPESKAYGQSEPQSPYLNTKSCSVRLTWLKGSQSVTQHLPSSVAINPEAAYDGLGGHSKIYAFPVPSPKKLKYSGTSKPKTKVTVSYK